MVKLEIRKGANCKYGLSTVEGTIVKEQEYDYVKNIAENLWTFRKEGGYIEIDRVRYDEYGDIGNLEIIMDLDKKVKSARKYGSYGVLVHTEKKGDGFLDNKGRWVLPIGYENIYLVEESEKELTFEVPSKNLWIIVKAVFSNGVWNIIN